MLATMNARGTPMGEKLVNLKNFAKETVRIVLMERPLIAKSSQQAPVQVRRQVDVAPEAVTGREPTHILALEGLGEEEVPGSGVLAGGGDALSKMIKATSIVVVSPAPPQKFATFKELFPAAICYRVERATCFFQRHNPDLSRDVRRPFLLSTAFAERLFKVVNQIIVPAMISGSRIIGMMETTQQWAGVSTAEFWEILDRDERGKTGIVAAWAAAWDGCRQRRENRVARDGTKSTVLVASPTLLKVREILAPAENEFTIPPIRNDEITLFASMLYELDIDRMEHTWNRLRQLYEQELDRRQYQDKAREGALRDSILNAFEIVPDLTGDFLALLCYYCFDNFDLALLERFTHNKGTTPEQRKKRIPYLMNFLAGESIPEARRREQAVRAERDAEREAAREAERRAQ
jgi:hypothetical protein